MKSRRDWDSISVMNVELKYSNYDNANLRYCPASKHPLIIWNIGLSFSSDYLIKIWNMILDTTNLLAILNKKFFKKYWLKQNIDYSNGAQHSNCITSSFCDTPFGVMPYWNDASVILEHGNDIAHLTIRVVWMQN